MRARIILLVFLTGCGARAAQPAPHDAGSVDVVDMSHEADVQVSDAPDMSDPRDAFAGPFGDGAACEEDADCLSGTCRTGEAFPGGFCTNDGCDGGCGEDGWCSYSEALGNFCAPLCAEQADCREGYACRAQGVPLRRLCTPIRGADDGEACESRDDCQGGTCLPWPDGYCTTNRCESDADCASLTGANNVCVDDGAGGICLRECSADDECRPGYRCQDPGDGRTLCLEDLSRPFDDTVFEPGPLGIECGIAVQPNGRFTIEYDVAPDTTSYQIVPMTRDGAPLTPHGITAPSGQEFNFVLEREFMRLNASLLISMSPTVVPPAPAFANMLAAGPHLFRGTTSAAEVCYYLVHGSEAGTVLDLNVYRLGVDAEADFAEVFAEVDRIFAPIGVRLGTIRTIDLDAVEHEILRSERDVMEIVRLSSPPGATFEAVRGVNLFFVRQFLLPDATVGFSTGLPGPIGLHGTHGSGLVFTAEYMGGPAEDTFGEPVDGNEYTALIVAHELGHWLGLRHTTERDGTHDPLGDTGECGNPNLGEACPDWGNLMFPFARAGSDGLTAEQGAVVTANPALR